jgi:S-formylglutathione hydrolase
MFVEIAFHPVYDRHELAKTIQGTDDEFYKAGQLLPENFLNAARKAGYDEVQVHVREQVGYDHSYYFVSTHSEFFKLQKLS